MPDDIKTALAAFLAAGDIEQATVTVVIKPPVPSPLPADTPVCRIIIGPVSNKR